jgi:DNA-binding MarR family transcriptional regulator
MAQDAENKNIDSIPNNLFHIIPMIQKKLLRTESSGAIREFPNLHLIITSMIRKDRIVVSKVAGKLAIPKSQITHPIDKLVDVDIVAKHYDTNDRRVINISSTSQAKKAF